ncbi:MAG: class I SAM-dependent methyltransferase [Candidatus Micrarchaeia archaeon]
MRNFYPEGIPWPLTRLYARLTSIRIFKHVHAHFLSRLAKIAKRGARVLDVGMGPGQLPIALARKRPDLKIVGMDISPDMVAIARENALKSGARVNFLQGSASALPFPPSSFDLVFSTLSLHHWREPEKAFSEIRRVLRKGGKVVVWDVAADAPQCAYDRLRIRYGWLRTLLFLLHRFTEPYYSKKEAAELARKAGFSSLSARFDGIFFRLEATN